MIKIIYICDFCKQTVSKEKDLYKVKVPDLNNLYGFSTPDHSVCINCYTNFGLNLAFGLFQSEFDFLRFLWYNYNI